MARCNRAMSTNVLIAGAGQIGSRYLQGLAKVSMPLNILIVDSAPESLARAESRWREVVANDSAHNLSLQCHLDQLPFEVTLAIVATTADRRSQIVSELAGRARVSYWVLEKVLAQSDCQIREIENAVAASNGCWVNTPMYMWSLYQRLRSACEGGGPIHAIYEDVRGLACNTIHYLDLVSRWNGASPVRIDTSRVDGPWHEAERKGFFEIWGQLDVSFSDGSQLSVTSKEHDRCYRSKLITQENVWGIHEQKGFASNELGDRIEGNCELQSVLTPRLVESILATGTCPLPTLAQSAVQHRAYLRDLIAHWNATMPERLERLPIT